MEIKEAIKNTWQPALEEFLNLLDEKNDRVQPKPKCCFSTQSRWLPNNGSEKLTREEWNSKNTAK